jgi:hypothetical protein
MLWPKNSLRLSSAELRGRAAEFRTSLDQLCQSAEALRKEVGGLEVTQVFSAKVYKDAESLEKLGKKVKALSKL